MKWIPCCFHVIWWLIAIGCLGCVAAEEEIPMFTTALSKETVRDVRWLDSAILVTTDTGKLLRSVDQGQSWTTVQMPMGKVEDMIVSPADTDVALVMSRTHVCTTRNAGEEWTMMDLSGSSSSSSGGSVPVNADSSKHSSHGQQSQVHPSPIVEAAKMHARYPSWVIVLVRDDPGCERRSGSNIDSEAIASRLRETSRFQRTGTVSVAANLESRSPVSRCLKKLFITRDAGQTMELAPMKVFDADWSYSNAGELYVLVPSSSFFSLANPEFMDVVITDTNFKNKRFASVRGVNKVVVETSYSLASGGRFVDELLFLQQPNILRGVKGTAATVMISSNHGQYFSKARIPPGMQSFEVLDTSEGQVFLCLEMLDTRAQTIHRHLFVSDALGTNYSLSLPYLADPQREFVKIEGMMDGVFIANVLDQHGSVLTMITHNRGATWKRLPVPVFLADHAALPPECRNDPDCTLHLADLEESLESSDSASGILLARGSVGRRLNRQNLGSFFSRDGGTTWEQLPGDGAHWFAIGDSGGILVMVEASRPTNLLMYTYDQALSWQRLEFAPVDQKVSVGSLEVDAVEKGTSFLLRGSKSLGEVGVLISFNLGANGLPLCANDMDYEKWVVAGGGVSTCLLGREVTITRRKRNSRCLNGIHREQVEYTRVCECTDEDFECDVGFVRDPESVDSLVCLRDESVDLNYTLVEPPICHGSFEVSRGYRKIAGDVCEKGVDHSPKLVACKPKGMRGKGWLLLLIIGVLAYLIVKGGNRAGELFRQNHKHFPGLREANFCERLREWIESLLGYLPGMRSPVRRPMNYELIGGGRDVPERAVDDVFLDLVEEDEEEAEEIKEIEVGVIPSRGSWGPNQEAHFTLKLPGSSSSSSRRRGGVHSSGSGSLRSDLGDDDV